MQMSQWYCEEAFMSEESSPPYPDDVAEWETKSKIDRVIFFPRSHFHSPSHTSADPALVDSGTAFICHGSCDWLPATCGRCRLLGCPTPRCGSINNSNNNNNNVCIPFSGTHSTSHRHGFHTMSHKTKLLTLTSP